MAVLGHKMRIFTDVSAGLLGGSVLIHHSYSLDVTVPHIYVSLFYDSSHLFDVSLWHYGLEFHTVYNMWRELFLFSTTAKITSQHLWTSPIRGYSHWAWCTVWVVCWGVALWDTTTTLEQSMYGRASLKWSSLICNSSQHHITNSDYWCTWSTRVAARHGQVKVSIHPQVTPVLLASAILADRVHSKTFSHSNASQARPCKFRRDLTRSR